MNQQNRNNLADFFENTYRPLRLLGGAEDTIKLHRIVQRHFARYLGRPPELTDLTDEHVAGWACWLQPQMGPTTVNSYLAKLVAVWRFANRKQVVSTWPELGRLKEPKRLPKAWSTDEFDKLLQACKLEPGQVGGVVAARWWFALATLLYFTGSRIGAALELRWQDINLEEGSLIFPAESMKQFADQRFELPEFALEALRLIREPQRSIVFPWVKSPSMLWRDYTRVLERAGLATDRKSKFHRVRKTSASLVRKAGGDATTHMGHSSPKVTEAYIDERIAGSGSQCHLLPTPTTSIR